MKTQLKCFVLQTEQILNEYKIRALACHPDKHLDNPTAGKRPTCQMWYLTKLYTIEYLTFLLPILMTLSNTFGFTDISSKHALFLLALL